MEAREFRKGNLVSHNFHGIVAVEGVHPNGELLCIPCVKEEGYVKGAVKRGWRNLADFEGIPITEDWLRKFGFSDATYKNGYTGVDFKGGNVILDFVLAKPFKIGERQKFYAFEMQGYRYKEVEFVHQLQNLFFALTGTELQLQDAEKSTF